MASQYRRRSLMLNTIAKVAQGNPTIITDSSSRRLKRLDIYGQSEQASTTGTNLLSDEYKRKTYDNAYYYENDGLELKSGKKYILNTSEIVSDIYFIDHTSKEILAVVYENTKVEYTPNKDITVHFQIYKSGGLSDDVLIWLNVGEYSDYEPYTGGKPSPSPDYHQEIISKEVSEIKLTGKNKLPFPFKLFTEERTIEGVTFTPLENGGIKINGTSTNVSYLNLDNYPYEKGYTCTLWYENGAEYQQGVNSMFFGHDSNNEYVYIYIPIAGITYNNLVLYPMQSLENVSNSYEPYKEQKITLSEPITLRGIPVDSGGNVTIDGQQYISDVIKEKDGVIGVERNIVSGFTIDGSDDESWRILGNALENTIRFVYRIKALSQYNGISEQLKFEAKYNLDTEHFYFDGENLIIFINKNRLSTQDTTGLKAWLQTNPLTFNYVSVTPTFEPLPENIQAQYKALKSYYPNTVIQTGCWNEVTYSAKRGG